MSQTSLQRTLWKANIMHKFTRPIYFSNVWSEKFYFMERYMNSQKKKWTSGCKQFDNPTYLDDWRSEQNPFYYLQQWISYTPYLSTLWPHLSLNHYYLFLSKYVTSSLNSVPNSRLTSIYNFSLTSKSQWYLTNRPYPRLSWLNLS